jgi:hypothetical protein
MGVYSKSRFFTPANRNGETERGQGHVPRDLLPPAKFLGCPKTTPPAGDEDTAREHKGGSSHSNYIMPMVSTLVHVI